MFGGDPFKDKNKYKISNISDRNLRNKNNRINQNKSFEEYQDLQRMGISDCRLESMGPSQFFQNPSNEFPLVFLYKIINNQCPDHIKTSDKVDDILQVKVVVAHAPSILKAAQRIRY